jgi:hypothetical protein
MTIVTKNINAEKIQGNLDVNSISATTITGDTYFSGSTNLTDIINNISSQYSADTSVFLHVSGGTVTGSTTFTNGLFVDTISATTYQNLPIDVFVTGITYNNNNQFTFTNNTGGTFNILFNEFSGITVNGITNSTELSTMSITATSISNVDTLDFNTNYTGNTILAGRMYWNVDNGTIGIGMENSNFLHNVGQEYYYHIKNQSSDTIEIGKVIRASGTLGSSGKILGEYMIADGSIPVKYTLGIATEDILDGDDGYVTEFGLVKNINTTGSLYGEAWIDGDILYVSPTISGGLTKFEPEAPNLKIEMAIVIKASSNGSIFVRPNRYPYLNDLQNLKVTGATLGDLLVYNSNHWGNSKTLTGDYTINGGLSATTISASTYLGLPIDVFVTGSTYSNNTFTFTNNTGGTFNTSFNTVTGLTINGTLSATTYENLPVDVFVTGGTYSAGTAEFTNNTGGTFSVTGFSTSTGGADTFITGGTYANGITTFINNTGGTFTISGYQDGLAYSGESFLIVTVGYNQVTNGDNLKAAYTYATTRTPYGSSLSNDNRYSIILQPGIYDIGSTTFTLSNNFIDLIGLSSDPNLAIIYSSGATVVTIGSITNYRLKNLTIENDSNNAAIFCIGGVNTTTRSIEEWDNIVFKYGLNAGVNTRIHDNGFTFSGKYSNINLLTLAVGIGSSYPSQHLIMNLFSVTGTIASGTLSGIFNDIDLVCFFPNSSSIFNCITYNIFNAQTLSGTFTNINYNTFTQVGAANPVFPSRTDIGGVSTSLTGLFNNINVVTRHNNYPLLNVFGSNNATVSGTFRDIVINNVNNTVSCFGGSVSDGSSNTSSGYFENIRCFSSLAAFSTDTSSGTFINCTIISSSQQNRSFGGGSTGNASGIFINCTALCTGAGENRSFGGNQGGFNGSNTASGRFINCVARSNTGAITSFGGFSHGNASGVFINCEATTTSGVEQRAFGGSTVNGFSGTGLRINKTGQWTARVSGYVRDSDFIALGANQSAISQIQNNAKLMNVRAVSTGSGLSLNSTTTVSASTYLCAFNTTPFSGITNLVITPYNVIDINI